MTVKRLFLVIALLCSFVWHSYSQGVTVEAKIDSLEIFIGEQTKLSLKVTSGKNSRVIFPTFTDTIIKSIEVLEQSKVDSSYMNNGNTITLTRDYLITSFDSALYRISPISVMVDTTEYFSNPIALKVNNVPIDESDLESIYGTKEVLDPPFVWRDWIYIIIMFSVALLLIGLILVLAFALFNDKPIIRKVKVERKLPPHILAINKINSIKQNNEERDIKTYYTELTDVLRDYIKERFNFNALEMTTSEIIDNLKKNEDVSAINELKELLTTSDLVKFAKYSPEIRVNDLNLMNAIEFINTTKVEEAQKDEANEKEEITIIEKRTLTTKLLFIVAIIVSLGLSIYLLVTVFREIYFSFFSK